MEIIETSILNPKQKQQVFELWNNEYPLQLCYKTIAELNNYLGKLQHQRHFFAAINNQIAGWTSVFEREGETWFAIIVDNNYQHKSVGTTLLNRLKQEYMLLNGWVIDHERYVKLNGEVYQSPLGFYVKNGFTVLQDTRLEVEILSAVKIVYQISNNYDKRIV